MAGHENRENAFRYINDPLLAPTKERQIQYEICQDRLDRILNHEGDTKSETIPETVQTFEEFCKIIPEWSSSKTSYVFHRDDQRVAKKDVLCQRAQLSGLCYIHAPDMLQHYLVSINTKESAPMIDISKLIRDTYNAQQLEEHIFEYNKGRSSQHMLKIILEPGSHVPSTEIENIEKKLKQYGPLLVSQFEVFQDFYQSKTSAYHGKPKGERLKGTHAMIIIGARTDQVKKNYYLLQNWWKRMQFAEVDEAYLESCDPSLYYVKTPQLKIPDKFSVNSARYAENENLDQPDSYPEFEGPLEGFDYHSPYIHDTKKKETLN